MKEKIIEMYIEQKLTISQISKETRISYFNVRYWLIKHDLAKARSAYNKRKFIAKLHRQVSVGQIIGRKSTCGAYLYGGE